MIFPHHIVAVAGLVKNSEGQVLLIKNPRRGWEFPGGMVDEGEDIISALGREIKEETGITCSIGKLVGVYSNVQKELQYDGVSETKTKLILDFLCNYISGDLETSDESLEVSWVEQDKALRIISEPNVFDRMKQMLGFSGEVIYMSFSKNPYSKHIEKSI